MTINNSFCDIQSQADARVLLDARVVHTIETFEDVIKLLSADPYTLVDDAHQILLVPVLQAHGDFPSMWRVFDCIVEYIANNLLHTHTISHDCCALCLNVQVD